MSTKDDKHYAYFEHETVQAMLHSLFRFQTAMQAQLVSNRFADQVILAPKMSDPRDRKAIILWVRDLDVTDEQRKLGYLGNYGKISLLQLPNGKWTLSMVRIDVPLVKHPLKIKVARRYPNTGHPVLRAAERSKPYPTMQAASDALMQMHEEYPEVSVPGVNRLRIMMYRKVGKGERPVQRVELSVTKRDEGVYLITMKVLGSERRPTTQSSETPLPASLLPAAKKAIVKKSTPVEGRHTASVVERRARKKKK